MYGGIGRLHSLTLGAAHGAAAAAEQTKVGPWGLGDEFWPLAEDTLSVWLAQNTKQGGIRAPAAAHRDWQNEALIIGDEEVTVVQPAPIHMTCAEKHAGFCVTQHATAATGITAMAKRLHQIRYLL